MHRLVVTVLLGPKSPGLGPDSWRYRYRMMGQPCMAARPRACLPKELAASDSVLDCSISSREERAMRLWCRCCGYEGATETPARFCPRCGIRVEYPRATRPSVQLVEVSKAFGEKQVLRAVSFEAFPGESLVIVGLSGSGKSVLLDHIIGFQQPDSGSVFVGGVSPLRRDTAAKQTQQLRLGMVFQGAALLDALTVRENVLLASVGQATAAANDRSVDAYLQAVGIPASDGDLYPASLSGGMQKRVGIARTLIQQPDILLYDEPTTGLDAATSASISRLMRQVQQERPQMTSIIITHDYLSAGLIADRVLYLNRQTGGIEEILTASDVVAIRQQSGGQEAPAVREIRGRLEAFFDQVELSPHSGRAPPTDGSWSAALLSVTTGAFHALGSAVLLLPRVGRPQNGWSLLKQLYEVGYKSLLITGLTGLFLGLMLTLQIATALRDYGYDSLPGLVGMILIEKLGPLFVGLLLAGRLGASISADIGGKRLTRQFEALQSMSISPERYWLAAAFWASLVSLPLLTLTLEVSGLAGAYGIGVFGGFINSAYFLEHVCDRITLFSAAFGWFRAALFGMAIALVAFAKGAEPKRDSEAIGRSTTQAVVGACLGVIGLDFVMTFLGSLWGA